MQGWFPEPWPYDLVVIGRLLLAALLGAAIGVEREVHGRPAGFRTHLLVSVGACLMMVVSEHFFVKYQALDSSSAVRLDPARVAAQIVTGIGFLGAGAIIKDGALVRGMTTAACLWVAAGIGMAVGVGLYTPSLAVTVLALGSLLFLKKMERRLAREHYDNLTLLCEDLPGQRQRVDEFLQRQGLRVTEMAVDKDLVDGHLRFDLVVACFGRCDSMTLVEEASRLPGMRKVRLH